MAQTEKQQGIKADCWPPRPEFAFYNAQGEFLFSERSPRLDLSDTLMLHWPRHSRKVILGLKSRGMSWTTWTEPRLRHVEKVVKDDLNFDLYSVTISRLTSRRWQPCTREFRWALSIRAR